MRDVANPVWCAMERRVGDVEPEMRSTRSGVGHVLQMESRVSIQVRRLIALTKGVNNTRLIMPPPIQRPWPRVF